MSDNLLASNNMFFRTVEYTGELVPGEGIDITGNTISVPMTYDENNKITTIDGHEIAGTKDLPKETVLWEGTYVGGTFPNITISESYKNFEYLEITLSPHYASDFPRSEVIQKFSTDNLAIDGACMSFTVTTFNNNNTYSYVHFISYKMSSETVIQAQFQSMYRQSIPINSGNVSFSNGRRDSESAYEYGIAKVVGINRKENV